MVLTDGSLVHGDDIFDNKQMYLPGFRRRIIDKGGFPQKCIALDVVEGIGTKQYVTITMSKKK